MQIHVTQRHIDDGRTGRRHCPIALALQDADYAFASVGSDEWVFWHARERRWRRFPTPARWRKFIKQFDAGRAVFPFSTRVPVDPGVSDIYKRTLRQLGGID